MRFPKINIASLLLTVTAGCAYHGAVYSEHAQFALDVRSSAASSSPINVGFGYDRGVLAYVPKLHGRSGEACSIVSWQNTGSTVAPATIGTGTVLRVDAGFISGIAAEVASAPADAEVVIVPGPEAKTGRLEVKTTGGPGERIATALSFAPATLGIVSDALQLRRESLFQKLAHLDAAKAGKVLAAAGVLGVPPDQAVSALQDKIVDARDPQAVKKLEDAFNTVE